MEAFLLLHCIIMEKHFNQINTLWWNKEKGSRLTDSQRAKENLNLSHVGPSYRLAFCTNPPIKAWLLKCAL